MHGWLAFLAGILSVIGFLLLFAAFSGITYLGFGQDMQIAFAIVLLAIAAIAAWMLVAAIRSTYFKVKTGKEALVGARGVSVTNLDPKGEIRVMGEFWQAATKGEVIEKGKTVVVVDMEGILLVVKLVEDKA